MSAMPALALVSISAVVAIALLAARCDASSAPSGPVVGGGGRRSLLLPPRTKITWVNGIAHLPEHMDDPTSVISAAFGGADVDYCHNPSAMTTESDYLGFTRDLAQASSHQMGRTSAEVDALVGHLRDALAAVGGRGRVVHLAHSQGAAITRLAAERLTADECRRIEVVSFGGAAIITTSDFPFARCINYYAVNDPILNVVPSAVKVLRSGFAFGGGTELEIVFLTSRTGDPVTDHGLLNPTYLEALLWEGQRYRALYLSPVGRAVDAAFVMPLATSLSWLADFSKFAYEVTRRAILAIIRLLVALREIVRKAVYRLLNREKEEYQPVPSLS